MNGLVLQANDNAITGIIHGAENDGPYVLVASTKTSFIHIRLDTVSQELYRSQPRHFTAFADLMGHESIETTRISILRRTANEQRRRS